MREVASVLVASLAMVAFIYSLPIFGVPLSIIFAALLVARGASSVESSVYGGLFAGLLGYLLSYLVSGAGLLGIRILAEPLGWLGPLIPLLYYPLAVAALSGLIYQILGRDRKPAQAATSPRPVA